ncbi:MAG: photosystem II stability/assembly factor-like uncharacterized protein [Bacteroidia bacterium]|jgi:photosystem II stability/assembly factor-like uncharacterized protein
MKNTIAIILILLLANTAKSQTTWAEIPTPTNKDLNMIQFVSDQIGYVGGDSVLLKTIDGGATWSEMMLDSIPNSVNQTLDFLDMHWFDENHGIIMAGPWGGGSETFDGGLNWDYLSIANLGFCQTTSLFFFDEDNGFAGGAGCFEGHIIERFENGTWSTTNHNDPENWNSSDYVTSIEFYDDMNGFAGTVNGTLLRTDDGGLNWDTIPNIAGDSAITDFIFYDADVVRATHKNNSQFGVMISNDGGLTWGVDWETATFLYPGLNAAHIAANGTTYLGGGGSNSNIQGVIFENSGIFWNWVSVDQPINDITSYGDSTTFLVGDSGAIYVNVLPTTLGITDTPTIEFTLAPNPAHNHIQVAGLDEEVLGFTISDISGRTVLAVNETAFDRFEINVSNLTKGCYFLNLQTEQGQGTKRFVKL